MVKTQSKPKKSSKINEIINNMGESHEKIFSQKTLLQLLEKEELIEERELVYETIEKNLLLLPNITVFSDLFISDASKGSDSAFRLLIFLLCNHQFSFHDISSIFSTILKYDMKERTIISVIDCLEMNILPRTSLEKLLSVVHNKMFVFNTPTTFYLLKIFGTIVQKDIYFSELASSKGYMIITDVLQHSIEPISEIAIAIRKGQHFNRYKPFTHVKIE